MERFGEIIQIAPGVRVERGHVRRNGIATEELLRDSVTASHYQVGALDAIGNVIELDKPMVYIDWLSDDRVWYVYRLEYSESDEDGEPIQRYVCRGSFESESDAVEFARKL